MDLHILALRRSVMIAVGLSLSACAPVIGTVETGETGGTGTPVDGCGGTPILGPNGVETGFERCPDGVVLRTKVVGGVPTTITAPRCEIEEGACQTDAQCTAKPNGACLDTTIDFPYCSCVYACASDADCGENSICLAPGVWDGGPAWGTCVRASCTVNADCASEECSFTVWNDGCGDIPRLDCRAPTDVCRVDSDCPAEDGRQPTCAFDYSGDIGCRSPNCDIGRPFTDDRGAWRQAEVVARSDWLGEIPPLDGGLSDADRAVLIAHWTEVARLEHASVASFARHTLELMALGAPADLLSEVQRAAADEVRHAQLAFGMIAALGGGECGPGPLSVDDMGPRLDPVEVLRGLIEEGCIGETLGAAEARMAAERAVGPIAQVLAEIAEDETRHALLAWRTARWVIDAFGLTRDELPGWSAPAADLAAQTHPLAAYGMLHPTEQSALHGRIWREVIGPALDGLFDRTQIQAFADDRPPRRRVRPPQF